VRKQARRGEAMSNDTWVHPLFIENARAEQKPGLALNGTTEKMLSCGKSKTGSIRAAALQRLSAWASRAHMDSLVLGRRPGKARQRLLHRRSNLAELNSHFKLQESRALGPHDNPAHEHRTVQTFQCCGKERPNRGRLARCPYPHAGSGKIEQRSQRALHIAAQNAAVTAALNVLVLFRQ